MDVGHGTPRRKDPAGSASEETDSDNLRRSRTSSCSGQAKRALFLSVCLHDGCTSAGALGSLREPECRPSQERAHQSPVKPWVLAC